MKIKIKLFRKRRRRTNNEKVFFVLFGFFGLFLLRDSGQICGITFNDVLILSICSSHNRLKMESFFFLGTKPYHKYLYFTSIKQ